LREAGIYVFSVAISNRVDEVDVRGISTYPQLVNFNYFLSPAIPNLNSLSSPLAAQVWFSIPSAVMLYCRYLVG